MDPGPINNGNIRRLVKEYFTDGNPRGLIPIGQWNVSRVTDMSSLFESVYRNFGDDEEDNFNEPLNDWDVSNVTNMESMFSECVYFNQPLDKWNVSNVRNMKSMFSECHDFNQPLNSWNVSNVRNMDSMFSQCSSFNQPLDQWNVSNVRNMYDMFLLCRSFNQPLNMWNIENVEYVSRAAVFSSTPMEEKNLPIYNSYKEYLESGKTATAAISGKKIPVGRTADGTVLTKETPDVLTREILEYAYPKKIVEKVYQPGLNRGENYRELLKVREKNAAAALPQETAVIAPPLPPSSGETAADALGGRTRRRHGKRKTRKSRKSRKRRHTKRR
jgi:surface protein